MRKLIPVLCLLSLVTMNAIAQDDKKVNDGFQFTADGNLFLIEDDSYINPVFQADRNWLHLEGRYNYEDHNTASSWLGYNIKGGADCEYTITPMGGIVFGNTEGLTAGIEISIEWSEFYFDSETEYLFNSEGSENNYLYSWTDLSYAPLEWFWLGISGQRLRYDPEDLLIHRGIMLGGGGKAFEFNAYAFNIFSNQSYYVLSASLEF